MQAYRTVNDYGMRLNSWIKVINTLINLILVFFLVTYGHKCYMGNTNIWYGYFDCKQGVELPNTKKNYVHVIFTVKQSRS